MKSKLAKYIPLTTFTHKFDNNMKKYVLVLNAIELLKQLMNGKRVEGVLYVDGDTGKITFRPYHRLSREHKKVELLKKTPWGWVKGSVKRYKRYSSIPKDLSLVDQLTILNEENELAKQALVDQHIIESI